jgi:hypothetical protein
MPAVLDQMKDVAYTSVGVNLLVGDAVATEVRKNSEELLERLGEPGERVQKFLDENEISTPDFVEEYATKARSAATESLTDLRGRMAPRTDKLVERLPERVGEAVLTGRKQMWDFIGIDAPKAKVAPKATPKAKATPKKRARKAAPKAKAAK